MRHKNKTLTFILLFLLVFTNFAPVAFSQVKNPDKASNDPKKKKEPVEVTAEKMRSENKGEKITFTGNVVSLWGDTEVKSDTLVVTSKKDSTGAETNEIVAIGNVDITRGVKKAKGDRAVYLEKEQKIILTSETKALAWEGKDWIEGKEMIFLMDQDKFLVNERVKMKFYPKDKDESEKDEKSSTKTTSRKK